jgi:molybdopterin converting factor subunit 1
MKTITVLFFATLRDHMGTRQVQVSLPDGAGVADLKAHLVASRPGAEDALEIALVAINQEYAFAGAEIPDGAEVAFFPHVSGG